MSSLLSDDALFSRKHGMVLCSSTAIALCSYDHDVSREHQQVLTSHHAHCRRLSYRRYHCFIYYLGCAIGAVIASFWAEKRGRTPSTFACLTTITFGNLLMFISGLNGKGGGSSSWNGAALACMLTGRVVMGLGVWRNRRCDSRLQFRTIF